MAETIYALSSGQIPSGVAVIRVSGPHTRFVLETMCINKPFRRGMFTAKVNDPSSNIPIDSGLIAIFPGPNSFTGEDVLEFQLHGGLAVVDKLLDVLSKQEGLRHADAGEFTYRAFENGKLDLTQAEGIADLIDSETENQRQLAFDNLEGKPKRIIEEWSEKLVSMRALIEAEIDFVDEDDIPGSISDQVWVQAETLLGEIDLYLDKAICGEIIRDGFKVALLGRPNSGKSTLINALAQRDVAIVTDQPGTTRDVLNISLDLNGQAVIVFDTAGVRETSDKIEIEGIRRSLHTSKTSHLTVWLEAIDDEYSSLNRPTDVDLIILTKTDLKRKSTNVHETQLSISAHTGEGMDAFVTLISKKASDSLNTSGAALFSSQRQRSRLIEARESLNAAITMIGSPFEIRAEHLRFANEQLGAIVGKIDVEDLLDVIFSKFCVGK